jgi:hypothetical protein
MLDLLVMTGFTNSQTTFQIQTVYVILLRDRGSRQTRIRGIETEEGE